MPFSFDFVAFVTRTARKQIARIFTEIDLVPSIESTIFHIM